MNNDTPADAITQGIDVFAERQAFEAWWKQWVPDGTMPSLTSHIFDAWLASVRHRTTSLAAQDGLVEENERLRKENAHLQKQVMSNILPGLLDEAETDTLVDFIKHLRVQAALSAIKGDKS